MDLPAHDADRLAAAARSLGLELVVLFGSYATGSPPPHAESDVDLALLPAQSGPAPSLLDAYEAMDGVFGGARPDPVLLHRADPLFRHEIMRRGVLLYGDVDRFLEYRAFAFRAYVDASDLLALERLLFERKMARIEEALGVAP